MSTDLMGSINKICSRTKKIIKGLWHDIFKYIYIVPFDLKPIPISSDDWFDNVEIIPHAMGSIEGNSYTNSYEAFNNAIANNLNVLEIDVQLTKDSIPVLCHNEIENKTYEEFMSEKILYKYTPMSLSDLIDEMRKNTSIYSLLDIKKNQEKEIVKFLKENADDIIDRFIIQVARVKTYKTIVKIHKFKYFHWNFSVDGNVNYHLGFVVRNKIPTCSVTIKSVKNKKTLQYLNKFNVKSYAYTVNTKELYNELKNKNCYGIITDCIEDMKK